MLVVVFAVWLGWLPAQGFPRAGWADPAAAFRALLLPALTIGIVEGAMLMRFVRSATLQAVGQDYVRTAAAKGLTRNAALIRHGLPDVGLSVITVLGLQVAGIIVGAVVIEQLFSLPGIGRMLVADVSARDLPKVQGELLALTGFVLDRRLRRRPRPPGHRPAAAGGVMTGSQHAEADDRPTVPRAARGGRGCGGSGASPPGASGSSSSSVVVATAVVSLVLDAVRPAAGRHREPLGAAGLAAPARHGRVGTRHPEPHHGGRAHDRDRRGRRGHHRDRRSASRSPRSAP